MLRAYRHLWLLCLAGCAFDHANDKASNDEGIDELHRAIVQLCENEQHCTSTEERSVDECVQFLSDVAQHSYPSQCYELAAHYATCLSKQHCEDYEDTDCADELDAIEACGANAPFPDVHPEAKGSSERSHLPSSSPFSPSRCFLAPRRS